MCCISILKPQSIAITKTDELERFQSLEERICQLNSDIWFISTCKKQHVIPKFIDYNLNCSIKISKSSKSIEKLKHYWLMH